jgi:dihydroorotase
LLSCNSAEFLGLKNKGKIKKGCIADLILVDTKDKWSVSTESFSGRAINTPFDGKELSGRVIATFIAGEKVYEYK